LLFPSQSIPSHHYPHIINSPCLGSSGQQQLDHFWVIPSDCPMQRGAVIPILRKINQNTIIMTGRLTRKKGYHTTITALQYA